MTVNTLGSLPTERSGRPAATWLWPIIPISLSAFSLSALVYYHLHHGMALQSPLQMLYAGIYDAFGLAPSVMFFLLTLTWSSIWFASGAIERPLARLARLLAMAVMLGIFLNLGDGGVAADVHKGRLGAWLAGILYAAFGYLPSLVVVWGITFASLLLATDFFFSERFERLREKSEPMGEGGVEPAVAEHLRTLATAVVPPIAMPASDAATVAEVGGSESPVAFADSDERPESGFESRRSRAGRAAERLARRGAAWSEPVVAPAGDEPVAAAAVPASVPAAAAEEPTPEQAPEPEPATAFVVESALAEPSAATQPIAVPEVTEAIARAEAGPELSSPAAEPVRFVNWYPAAPRGVGPEDDVGDAPVIAAASEPLVAIPRPDPRPEAVPSEEPARQRNLFGAGLDAALLEDAIDVVTHSGRANASLLQRKLRIDYQLACDVLAALVARGIVANDGDAVNGRGTS